jgi:cysteine desulfurase
VAIDRNSALLSSRDRLYLDHAATTPVLPAAREAMARALDLWANPSSPHEDGRKARAALQEAREAIAKTLDWRHDVILTSGASEAIQIVAARARVERRTVGPTEHDAVIGAMGSDAVWLSVDSNGIIDMSALEGALEAGPSLVAVQQVNNETGVIQTLEQIYEQVRDAGSLLFADCAQAAGKIPLPEADFIAISAHKFGGPPGAGALLVKDLGTLHASGGQERGYRRGTENLPAVVGMAAALESRAFANALPRLKSLREQLERELAGAGAIVVAAEAPRIPTIAAYVTPTVASAGQLVQFDLAGISISAGSACSSGSMKPSRILAAMGLSEQVAGSAIRVSFGSSTSAADVERFLSEWHRIRNRAKAEAA